MGKITDKQIELLNDVKDLDELKLDDDEHDCHASPEDGCGSCDFQSEDSGAVAPKNILDDFVVCKKCGSVLKEIWENNGFSPPDPTFWEIVGYKCPKHGELTIDEMLIGKKFRN